MNKWAQSNGGMILTGANWSTGRKTLHSVGGRWMNEHGAMLEWYWQGKTEVLGQKHYTAWVVDGSLSMEQWWNNTDRGKGNTGRKTLSSISCGWMNEHGAMVEWYWRENWSNGRKILHSVGGRWMNEHGAMEEWYWQGKTEVPGQKHYTVWVVDEWMNEYGTMVEWYWQGNMKYWEKNITHCWW